KAEELRPQFLVALGEGARATLSTYSERAGSKRSAAGQRKASSASCSRDVQGGTKRLRPASRWFAAPSAQCVRGHAEVNDRTGNWPTAWSPSKSAPTKYRLRHL